MQNDKMVFFRSWYEAVEELTDKQRLEWFDTLIAYNLYGIEPTADTDLIVRTLFKSNKPVMDKSIENAEKNRRNGKRGGRPKDAPLTEEEQQRLNDLHSKINFGGYEPTEEEQIEHDRLLRQYNKSKGFEY